MAEIAFQGDYGMNPDRSFVMAKSSPWEQNSVKIGSRTVTGFTQPYAEPFLAIIGLCLLDEDGGEIGENAPLALSLPAAKVLRQWNLGNPRGIPIALDAVAKFVAREKTNPLNKHGAPSFKIHLSAAKVSETCRSQIKFTAIVTAGRNEHSKHTHNFLYK